MAIAKVVADIMTRHVVTLNEEDDLVDINENMETLGLRHLPVVDDGRLVGIVSHRDILRVSAGALEPGAAQRDAIMKERTFVEDVMTRDVVSVSPDASVEEAAQLLLRHKFGCLPVVSPDGKLVGIVTEHDFVRLLVDMIKAKEQSRGSSG